MSAATQRLRDTAGIRETRAIRFDLTLAIDARDALDAARTYDDARRRMYVAVLMVYRRLLERGRIVGLRVAQDGRDMPVAETVARIRALEPVTH